MGAFKALCAGGGREKKPKLTPNPSQASLNICSEKNTCDGKHYFFELAIWGLGW